MQSSQCVQLPWKLRHEACRMWLSAIFSLRCFSAGFAMICATNQRPHIVIWSMSTHEVILLELTVCDEEGTEAAQLQKEAKYTELLAEIEHAKWTARLLTLEVGARGLVTRRARYAFLRCFTKN